MMELGGEGGGGEGGGIGGGLNAPNPAKPTFVISSDSDEEGNTQLINKGGSSRRI